MQQWCQEKYFAIDTVFFLNMERKNKMQTVPRTWANKIKQHKQVGATSNKRLV